MSAGIAIDAWSPMLSAIAAAAGIAGTATGVSNNPASASAARTKRRADKLLTSPLYHTARFLKTASVTTALPGGWLKTALSGLNRRTRHRSVRAKYAAVARLGLEPFVAALAVIKELAGVRRHLFGRLMPACGTGDEALGLHQRAARTVFSSGRSITFQLAAVMTRALSRPRAPRRYGECLAGDKPATRPQRERR